MNAPRYSVPVECQNGHKATSYYRWERQRFDFIYEGVPHQQDCGCPKGDLGQGWRAVGDPVEVTS